ELYINGQRMTDVEPSKRGVAMVFQSYALYPHMTVHANMAFGLKLAKTDKADADRRIQDAARMLKIEHLLGRLPTQLSVGQRARAEDLSARRAAVDPRPRPPRLHARRALAPAPAAQDHDGLRHPRSGRGHDHGRSAGHPRRRPHRAGRSAARGLSSPAHRLR